MIRQAPPRLINVSADRNVGYGVRIIPGWLTSADDEARFADKALVVTTPTVARLYGGAMEERLRRSGCEVAMLVLPVSEQAKTMETVLEVCRSGVAFGLGRDDLLIGFGGGVCTDIVTVAASLLRRGIPHVRVPTTLLGQVDAAIGIKGGVNAGAKNQLGCFYPPLAVIVDPHMLISLPPVEVRSGLAEIVKIAAVRDRELFERLEDGWGAFFGSGGSPSPVAAQIVGAAVAALLDELSPNLWEDKSRERLSDFGHSFSPAIEAASGYRIRHGEAVSIDMAICAVLARRLGFLAAAESERLVSLLEAIGLPLMDPVVTPQLCAAALEEAARHRGGRANLVLSTSMGDAMFVRDAAEVGQGDLTAALAELALRQRQPVSPISADSALAS